MVMTQEDGNGLDTYSCLPLKLIEGKKDREDNLILFQLRSYENTLLTPIELGDSDVLHPEVDTTS